MGVPDQLAPLALVMGAGLVAAGFWFVTTEVYAIKVSSEVWWFYLLLAALVLALGVFALYHSVIQGAARYGMAVVLVLLLAALVYLGIKFNPADQSKVAIKLGMVPAFSGNDGIEVKDKAEEGLEDVPQFTNKQWLPAPMDQGGCGSCWAVASAAVMSARYSRYLHESGREYKLPAFTNCTPAGVDMSGWHFSPQYLLDRDARAGPLKLCSADSSGKCNGNNQVAGFNLAAGGVPDSKCVPYFASESTISGVCPVECGSPLTENYLSCPENEVTTQCIHPESFAWTKCADETHPFAFLGEGYNVRHVIGEAAMKEEIQKYGPVLAGVNFYSKADGTRCAWALTKGDNLWGNYSDVVTPGFVVKPEMDGAEYTREFLEGGHALTIFGFGVTADGTKYWEAMNSWGAGWGSKGTIKIQRGVNAWNIESFAATVSVRDATNNPEPLQ